MDTTVELGVIGKEINKQNKGHDKQNTHVDDNTRFFPL